MRMLKAAALKMVFTAFITLPPSALAENLLTILIKGDYALTCQEGRQLVDDVQSLYNNVGINLPLSRYRCRNNPRKREMKLTEDSIGNTHWYYDEDYFVGRRYKGTNTLHHVVLPPIKHEGALYLAGYSYMGCTGKRVSISNATMFNAVGRPRYKHSVIAMAHELGHLFGADHDDSKPNIMHSAAMQYVDSTQGWLQFTNKTLGEMSQCKAKSRKILRIQ